MDVYIRYIVVGTNYAGTWQYTKNIKSPNGILGINKEVY